MKPTIWGLVIVLLALQTLAVGAPLDQGAIARRAELLKLQGGGTAVIDKLNAALNDPDAVVRHTAARLLSAQGQAALAALSNALKHPDPLVRRIAAIGLGAAGAGAVEALAAALSDDSPYVRQGAVLGLASIRPSSPRIIELISKAGQDDSVLVSETALKSLRYTFRVLESLPLPREGWKFMTDPDDIGRTQQWFAVDFDDRGWHDIAIESSWEQQGHNYDGVAWYRRSLDLPARAAAERVVMSFEAVDESAWLWVNGKYVGSHDAGPSGWDKPFQLDITDAIKWGERNQITVRVLDSAMAGGIWRPVSIQVLELAQ